MKVASEQNIAPIYLDVLTGDGDGDLETERPGDLLRK